MRLWDTNTGNLLHTLTGHTNWVNSITFSPDGNTLATGSYDDTARLWDVNTGDSLHRLTGHTDAIVSIALRVRMEKHSQPEAGTAPFVSGIRTRVPISAHSQGMETRLTA